MVWLTEARVGHGGVAKIHGATVAFGVVFGRRHRTSHKLDAKLGVVALGQQGAPEETRPVIDTCKLVLAADRDRLFGSGQGEARITADDAEDGHVT